MDYNIISTGSHGNAVVVNNNILIDCGIPFKSLKKVYKELKLVLLTHIHIDHFNPTTLKMLSEARPALRFGCCEWLINDLVTAGVPKRNIDVLELSKIYNYGLFKIEPVELCHNVPTCGYKIYTDKEKVFYATDTKHLDGITAENFDLYLIEANYTDDDLQRRIQAKLETGEYCYELNVANRHLSREQADEFLLANMGENSKYEYLHGHVEKEETQ